MPHDFDLMDDKRSLDRWHLSEPVDATGREIDSEEVRYWMPEHDNPDKEGHYSSVIGMRIDPSKVGDARIFRTWGWSIGLILSEDLKLALEGERITGTRFVPV